MAMSDALKKQKLAEFAKKLEDKDDWTKRNAALIDMQKLITDPEEPLKLTSREIIALRVALFQQLEDLRSTIVREGCGLVAKMVCMLYSL
jgi:deoxycytidine triphosphate deaminase